MRVAIYPDIPQLTDVDDGLRDEPFDRRHWSEIVETYTVAPWKVVRSLEDSHDLDEGDMITIEVEEHDFIALAAFAKVLRPEALSNVF